MIGIRPGGHKTVTSRALPRFKFGLHQLRSIKCTSTGGVTFDLSFISCKHSLGLATNYLIMANWSGVAATIQAIFRPTVLQPNLKVTSIAALDFAAFKSRGITGVVLDKDNCIVSGYN